MRRRRQTRIAFALLVTGLFAFSVFDRFGDLGSGAPSDATGAVPVPSFTITDGDTIRIGDERVRLLGLDTPETWRPGGLEEKALGDRATARLRELLASGPVTIERTGLDKHGRTLAVIQVSGRDVAPVLIAEGLALPRRPRDGWCARLVN